MLRIKSKQICSNYLYIIIAETSKYKTFSVSYKLKAVNCIELFQLSQDMPGSTITNPSLNDDLRDDDPDSRNQELDDERRIEADNEYYDGDKDQASFLDSFVEVSIQET